MKLAVSFFVLIAALFLGCTGSNRLERMQIQAPADADIAGTYTIVEETATGRSLDKSELKGTKLELSPDGKATFTDFPLFNRPVGFPGIFTKISEPGRWIIISDARGYSVELLRENGERLRAVVTEGGNPSDLILYYGPRESGYFIKLRKV